MDIGIGRKSIIMSSLNNNLDKNGSKVEFYEDMYRSGVIKKGGSAYKRLQEKCPKGRIEGITSQFSTSLSFFSWTNKILLKGLCYTYSIS